MTPQELRNSILQRAIEGKLVEQRAEEGTGEELYKLIQEEKKKLIKEGKIKKQKALDEIKEEEIPFDIPETWKWVRLGEVGEWAAGSTPSRTNLKFYGGNIPWLKTGDLNDGYISDVPEYITDLALEKTSLKLNPVESILIAMYGATIGKLGILTKPMTTNQACCACQPFSGIYNLYLFYFLMASRSRLTKMAEGGAQPNISRTKIISTTFPLPPLAEQKRIVEKLEELMPLIDDYEKNWQRLEELNKKFPEDMKKSFLQEAIKGNLVEQRAEEGIGEELYKLIQKEKKKLIKEGKIKKQKALDEIKEEEILFDIPKNWKWVRLGEIVLKLTDGAHHTPKYTSRGVPFVSVKDISSGKIDFSDCKYISKKEHEALFERCNPQRGDLLLTKVGTTGIPVIVDTDEEFSLFVSVALLKLPIELLDIYFLKDLINSPLVQVQAKENTRGVGNKNWVMRDIRTTIIPLPPLAEQKRIVEKLEELLPLCDELVSKEK